MYKRSECTSSDSSIAKCSDNSSWFYSILSRWICNAYSANSCVLLMDTRWSNNTVDFCNSRWNVYGSSFQRSLFFYFSSNSSNCKCLADSEYLKFSDSNLSRWISYIDCSASNNLYLDKWCNNTIDQRNNGRKLRSNRIEHQWLYKHISAYSNQCECCASIIYLGCRTNNIL